MILHEEKLIRCFVLLDVKWFLEICSGAYRLEVPQEVYMVITTPAISNIPHSRAHCIMFQFH